MKVIWLTLSSFGIMFAILSWMQESEILPPTDVLGAWKGLFAVSVSYTHLTLPTNREV